MELVPRLYQCSRFVKRTPSTTSSTLTSRYTAHNSLQSTHGINGIQKRFASNPSMANLFETLPPLADMRGITNCVAPLNTSRTFIEVSGKDTVKFLHNLTTRNLVNNNNGNMFYSAMLNSQGRIICDLFLYRLEDNKWLLDVDKNISKEVLMHLQKYKLRAQVQISDRSQDYFLWSMFGKDADHIYNEWKANRQMQTAMLAKDPRAERMGYRVIFGKDSPEPILPTGFKGVEVAMYDIWRMLQGVAEGSQEFPYEHSLPFECNLEYMNGVSFDKGCYLGQELTARTHYTGVIRKRLIPVMTVNPLDVEKAQSHHIEEERVNKITASTSYAEPKPSDPWIWGGASKGIFPDFLFEVNPHKPIVPIPKPGVLLETLGSTPPTEHKTRERAAAGKLVSGLYNMGMALLRLESINEEDPSKTIFQVDVTQGTHELDSIPPRVYVQPIKPFWWNQYLAEKRKTQQKIAEQFMGKEKEADNTTATSGSYQSSSSGSSTRRTSPL